MATLKFVGFIAELLKTNEMYVELENPVKLSSLLPETLQEDRTIVLINQDGASLDSFVTNEDKVLILPVISGG